MQSLVLEGVLNYIETFASQIAVSRLHQGTSVLNLLGTITDDLNTHRPLPFINTLLCHTFAPYLRIPRFEEFTDTSHRPRTHKKANRICRFEYEICRTLEPGLLTT